MAAETDHSTPARSIASLLNPVAEMPTLNAAASPNTDAGANKNKSDPSTKPKRRRITPEQLAELESLFEVTDTPSFDIRESVGKRLGMTNREVQIWFQNRRAKVNRIRALQASLAQIHAQRSYHAGPPGTFAFSPHPYQIAPIPPTGRPRAYSNERRPSGLQQPPPSSALSGRVIAPYPLKIQPTPYHPTHYYGHSCQQCASAPVSPVTPTTPTFAQNAAGAQYSPHCSPYKGVHPYAKSGVPPSPPEHPLHYTPSSTTSAMDLLASAAQLVQCEEDVRQQEPAPSSKSMRRKSDAVRPSSSLIKEIRVKGRPRSCSALLDQSGRLGSSVSPVGEEGLEKNAGPWRPWD
ncbi:uncharacterized protein VTP21DRAFT_978 [Calcarisporiella thermophila]|uniref:uncharacterized protein n=1 Tax=Calcarisporiella thermophila TaxID=911321 RepID=UPI003743E6CC